MKGRLDGRGWKTPNLKCLRQEEPPSRRQHHSLAWVLDCTKRRKLARQERSFLFFLTVNAIQPTGSNSCHWDFPTIMDCAQELRGKIDPCSFKLIQPRYFIAETRELKQLLDAIPTVLWPWSVNTTPSLHIRSHLLVGTGCWKEWEGRTHT